MLLPSDAPVVARDPALPAMALLLDPDAFVTWLARAAPWTEARGAEVTYLRYKKGVRLLVGYRLHTGSGESIPVHAWTTRGEDVHKLEKEAARAPDPEARGLGRYYGAGERILVECFPHDRRLPALREVASAARREAMLAGKLAGKPAGRDAGRTNGAGPAGAAGAAGVTGAREGLTLLSYKPERRFVMRAQAPAGDPAGARGPDPAPDRDQASARIVIRGLSSARFRRARRAGRNLLSTPTLRLPTYLGSIRSRHLILVEWLEGTPLTMAHLDALPERNAAELASRIGRGLAELHRQKAPRLARRGPRREGQGVMAAARGVATVLSRDGGRKARRMARTIRAHLELNRVPADRCTPLHGDAHPEQFLVGCDDGRLGLLDLDQGSMGDPMADLATFAAHLAHAASDGRLDPHRANLVESRLLVGYEGGGGAVRRARYRVQLAAALLRIAPHPFRDRTPEWPEVTRSLLARVEALLGDLHAGAPPPARGPSPHPTSRSTSRSTR